MVFNLDEGETDETITPKTKDARSNYRLESLLNAPDIKTDEYDELSEGRNMGKRRLKRIPRLIRDSGSAT